MRNHFAAPDETIQIRDFESLQAWTQQLYSIVQPRNLSNVQFELRELSDEQNRSVSALANGWRTACGCASGSFLMSVTVVSLIANHFVSGGHFVDIGMRQVGTLVGMAIIAALVGKLIGLLWARWRLLRLATKTRVRMAELTRVTNTNMS